MEINKFKEIVKKASVQCDVVQDKEEKSSPASNYDHKDLFRNPVKKANNDSGKEVKSKEDPDNSPKGLPERPTNTDAEGDTSDTGKIEVPDQSEDAVTGNGDGAEY